MTTKTHNTAPRLHRDAALHTKHRTRTTLRRYALVGAIALAALVRCLTPEATLSWGQSRGAPPPVATATVASPLAPLASTKAQALAAYGTLPLRFEANRGQTDPQVQFLARGPGYQVFLTPTEAVLMLRPQPSTTATGPGRHGRPPTDPAPRTPDAGLVLRMQVVHAHPAVRVTGQAPFPTTSNYFVGNDPQHWHTEVPTNAGGSDAFIARLSADGGNDRPDLTATWLTGTWFDLVQTCKTVRGTTQCTLRGAFEVRNQGTQPAPASQVQVFRSADTQLDPTNDALLTTTAISALAPGQRQKKVFSVALPPGSRATGQVVIAVVDAASAVTETNESNNVVVSGPVP